MRGSGNFRADGSFADISGRSGDVRYASHSDTKSDAGDVGFVAINDQMHR
jgi:hypothetical protein